MKTPVTLFEVSWEVCNLVGGIHTVLASKAQKMSEFYGDRYITIGPDLLSDPRTNQEFREEFWAPELVDSLAAMNIGCRMGRWVVPGEPRALLINFSSLHASRDQILFDYWERYRLHSLYGGWDYLEPVFFGHAAGLVIEHFFQKYLKPKNEQAVVQCHEWMTAAAMLHLRKVAPEIGSVFTTHATVLGRALSGNHKTVDLAVYDTASKLDQLAHENGVSAKHSMENVSARLSDCFTTVSRVTADECKQLLGREPDILLHNALGKEFPDPDLAKPSAVSKARSRLFDLAEFTTGQQYDRENTKILITAGRYEFKNKGVDVLLEGLAQVNQQLAGQKSRKVLAFFMLPAGIKGPRLEFEEAVKSGKRPQAIHYCTHELRDEVNDPVSKSLKNLQLGNLPEQNVHVVFMPIYLDGSDPLIPEKYYEFLAGADITAFPSYYEPWGYTPMESIAFGVPTVTSDLAGFGNWAQSLGTAAHTGVYVLARKGQSPEDASKDIGRTLLEFLGMSSEEHQKLREAAFDTSQQGRWKNWGKAYFEAHRMAIARAIERTGVMTETQQPRVSSSHFQRHFDPKTHMRNFVVLNKIPRKVEKLRDLAKNIWWSWNPDATELFSALDPDLWVRSGRNPTLFLDFVKTETLEAAAKSPTYLKKLADVLARFEKEKALRQTPKIAFFCAEYGLTSCLRFYSGGLGVLAGDIMKGASDLRLPMCGVGLAYHLGYFNQRINREGVQEAHYDKIDFQSLPIQMVRKPDGQPLIVSVPFPSRPVHARAWRVSVGNIYLYLLDTDFAGNRAEDRAITNALYGGDLTHRLRQEFILGIGGVKLLQALGISPQIYHMNEGHSALLVLARLLELMSEKNLQYEEALEYIRNTSIFTTHTPVAAGHDEFPEEIMKPYLLPFGEALHKDWSTLLALGKPPQATKNHFSMTYLCLRGSTRVNGVSEIHGRVSRQMFKDLYPGTHEAEIPVRYVTNGVHIPTWLAPEWGQVFTKHLGRAWREHLSEPEYWEDVRSIDSKVIWQTHQKAKAKLITALKGHIEEGFRSRREDPSHMATALAQLDKDPLIIGFARRFAPYKRSGLLFHNLKRFEALLSQGKSVVFVYSGKSHPSDGIGRDLIKRVIEVSRQPGVAGKVLFVENYDMDIAKLLVSGCDIWLNTPTRPLEASGTSGMKAAINGCLNLSVADGWWAEGYNGKNGWIIGDDSQDNPQDYQNEYDSAKIYALLEHEVIPMYFNRDEKGVPTEWVKMMKESIATIIPRFSAERMLLEYKKMFYQPAMQAAKSLGQDDFADLRKLCHSKKRIRQAWDFVSYSDVKVDGLERDKVLIDQPITISVDLNHPGLTAKDIVVQAVLRRRMVDNRTDSFETFIMEPVQNGHGGNLEASAWKTKILCGGSGHYSLGIRVLPRRYGDSEPELLDNLVKWL